MAAIAFHPRSAAVHHKGVPDYELAARLVESLPAPVILTGGLRRRRAASRRAFEQTGAAAVMLARGALGNPWLFAQLLGGRDGEPTPAGGAGASSTGRSTAPSSTWASERATRYLRKFYPWYVAAPGARSAQREAPAGGAAERRDAGAGARAARAAARAARSPPERPDRAPGPRYTAALAAALRRPTSPLAAGFCVSSRPDHQLTRIERVTCPRTSSSPPKDWRSSRTSSSCSPPRSAARSPSASRRRASSATSPRTPSTTTPRTSRRCSRAASPSCRRSCAWRP